MMGKIPPQDIGVEKALLGILLLNEKLIDEISSSLFPEDFYQKSHQSIFASLLEFKQEETAQTLDLVSFTTYLKSKGKLDSCGGLSYLAELTAGDSAALSVNASFYAQTVKALSRRRKVITFASRLRDKSYDISLDVQGMIDESEQELSALNSEGAAGTNYMNMNALVNQAIDSIQAHIKGEQEGIPSGFDTLDSLTGGFRNQELTIVGARPSIGKTAFALSIVLNMLLKNVTVGFFSLEMSATSLGYRLLSGLSRVDFSHIRKGTVTDSELSRIIDASGVLYEKKLYIQDTPNMKLMDLRAQARRMKIKDHVQIIFIDYIGLIEYENQNIERFSQVSQISRSLKQLARELDIPILCLCQVGRQAEANEPKLSDLRDSGSIEQDADQVILLHRARPKNSEDNKNPLQDTSLIMAKNRNGETGTYHIGFVSRIVRFENLSEVHGYSAGNNPNA